jgi:DNA polymerase III alpha subunit
MLINNSTEQLIQGILRHGPDILEHCQTSDDLGQYIGQLQKEHLHYPIPPKDIDSTHWFIPESYRTMDIQDWLYQRCPTSEIRQRVVEELRLFAKYDMIPMLKTMKYIVDTLRANNVVWGVGRGSSVASYVLYLLGVHRINSMYYNLDIAEFLR